MLGVACELAVFTISRLLVLAINTTDTSWGLLEYTARAFQVEQL